MPAEAVGTISQVWTQSQIDTADNPENLEFIGWGPRATAQSIEAADNADNRDLEAAARLLSL